MTTQAIKKTINFYFSGKSNAGVRREIMRVLSEPVDELWPVSHSNRVRNLGRQIAFSASGIESLEQVANAVEAHENSNS